MKLDRIFCMYADCPMQGSNGHKVEKLDMEWKVLYAYRSYILALCDCKDDTNCVDAR